MSGWAIPTFVGFSTFVLPVRSRAPEKTVPNSLRLCIPLPTKITQAIQKTWKERIKKEASCIANKRRAKAFRVNQIKNHPDQCTFSKRM